MNSIEEIDCGDKTIEIYIDEDPINPRTDCDNLDTIVCFHNRYSLGDKNDYKNFNSWDELEKRIIKDHNPIIIQKLYIYDHSGITISTAPFSCPWDSGVVGFVFVGREKALENWNLSKFTNNRYIKDRVEKYINASIEEYDKYLRGDCYGYVIKDKETDEELESCWGFFGMEYAIEEAKSAVEHIVIKPKENKDQLALDLA